MDVKSFDTLELPLILDRLAGYAAFSVSKALACNLVPTGDLPEAQRRQQETTEACLLLSINTDLTIGGAHDVRLPALAAARGKVLETSELLDLKSTLIAARNMRRHFDKLGERYPVLTALAESLEPSPGLIDAISRVIDERGEVLDNASEKLVEIRRDLRVVHDRLMTKLQRIISDPKTAPMLQEAIITQRDGRFVVPLRSEFKGRLKSVIHDQSTSGATLFVEPLTVVESNNQLRGLRLAERDEIRRILVALSQQVGDHAEAIRRTVDSLGDLDLAFAKARYAEALKANEPILRPVDFQVGQRHPGSTLRLLAARHPLLDPDEVVPIDLVLDSETYALVITGPNTGGKTVSLKTAGLLALMAQCGLHIPATSGSELSVFDAIYADIGDEQSIEQSLSTFSSHISNIIQILNRANSHSLVVIDELGAGTDPQEGAALARAILNLLLERSVTTLVATHYPELKTFAHVTPGVRNASVEFDLVSLRPTYHLTIGLPGRSNALAIANRLGLPSQIVEDAKTMVSPDDLQAESLLDEIHRQRDLAREERIDAEGARKHAQALEAELAQRLAAIDEERRDLLEDARAEAEAEVEQIQEQLADIRRKLAAAAQPLEVLETIEEQVDSLEKRVAEPVPQPPSRGMQPGQPLRLGDKVRLHTIQAEGVITGLSADSAEVQVGRLRVRAKLDELQRSGELTLETGKRQMEYSPPETSHKSPSGVLSPPTLELDLRGQTVDDALDKMEQYLDAAYLAAMPFVRIIHGKGTGRLRQAVREILQGNPYVASFDPGKAGEGGDGVTVVHLALG